MKQSCVTAEMKSVCGSRSEFTWMEQQTSSLQTDLLSSHHTLFHSGRPDLSRVNLNYPCQSALLLCCHSCGCDSLCFVSSAWFIQTLDSGFTSAAESHTDFNPTSMSNPTPFPLRIIEPALVHQSRLYRRATLRSHGLHRNTQQSVQVALSFQMCGRGDISTASVIMSLDRR